MRCRRSRALTGRTVRGDAGMHGPGLAERRRVAAAAAVQHVVAEAAVEPVVAAPPLRWFPAPSPVSRSLWPDPIRFSIPARRSCPCPFATRASRVAVTAGPPAKDTVSTPTPPRRSSSPRRPTSRSSPDPPSSTFGPSSPTRTSAPSPPVRRSKPPIAPADSSRTSASRGPRRPSRRAGRSRRRGSARAGCRRRGARCRHRRRASPPASRAPRSSRCRRSASGRRRRRRTPSVRPVQFVTGSASITGEAPRRSSTWLPARSLTVPSVAQSCAVAVSGRARRRSAASAGAVQCIVTCIGVVGPPHESVRRPMGGTRHRLVPPRPAARRQPDAGGRTADAAGPSSTCSSSTTALLRGPREPIVTEPRSTASPEQLAARGETLVVEHGAGEECGARAYAARRRRPRGARHRRRSRRSPGAATRASRRRSASASSCTPTTSACRTSSSGGRAPTRRTCGPSTGDRDPAAGRALASRRAAVARVRAPAGSRAYARRARRARGRAGATSRLSPLLHLGVVSPRRLVALADDAGAAKWRAELLWRDWFRFVLHRHPDLAERAVDARFERIAWRDDDARLRGLVPWRDRATGWSTPACGSWRPRGSCRTACGWSAPASSSSTC